jgi:hypothetical protein
MRLSVNLIANQTFFPMESEVPDDVVPKAIAAEYRLAPGQGAMRRAELGATGSFVPGVAYRMDESGMALRDEATRAAEEEQTARLLEIDEESWHRSGLTGPDISDAAMGARAMLENSPQAIESAPQRAQLHKATHVRRGPTWQPIGKVKQLKAGEILYAQINGRFVQCGRVPNDKETE